MFAHLKIKAHRASANRAWWVCALWQLGSKCVIDGVNVRIDSALATYQNRSFGGRAGPVSRWVALYHTYVEGRSLKVSSRKEFWQGDSA